jgi:glycosyltransferase involved in cell wall biosynthesis
MKILYVTAAWPGFRECIFEGSEKANGLPSFNNVLKEIVERGHEVDFVIIQSRYPESQINVGASWLSQDQVVGLVYTNNKFLMKYFAYIKLIYLTYRAIKRKDYDFVYAHGTTTGLSAIPARLAKIPFGQRIYGTFLWDKINKFGETRTFIKHLIEYLSFRTKKNFLLVTNDGSRGDLVKETIFKNKKEPYEFYYWINGVNKVRVLDEVTKKEELKKITNEPFLFYTARFDSWKRQDKAIKIIAALKKRGRKVNLYFAGPQKTVGGYDYYNSVMSLAKELGVDNQVVCMGTIDIEKINLMNQLATASLSLYDVCNLTNVFHEMLASGAVVITKDDGVVNDFIINGENGYLVGEDINEVVEIIENLLDNPELSKGLREEAIKTSRQKMRTWEQRIDDEINLISRHAKN